MLTCERCERFDPGDILACPHRAASDCAFEYWERGLRGLTLTPRTLGLIFFGFITVGGLFAALFTSFAGTGALLCSGVCLALIALIAGGIVTYRARTLYDPASGQMWREARALGFLVERQVVSALEPLPLHAALDYPLRYPASVSAFIARQGTFDDDSGLDRAVRAISRTLGMTRRVDVLMAAVVSLLADDVIAIERATVYNHTLGQEADKQDVPEMRYFFVPGPAAHDADPDGMLERAIFQAVNAWDRRPEAWRWPQGVPPLQLLNTLFPTNEHYTPGQQMLDLVRNDAIGHRLGVMRGGLVDSFLVDEAVAPKVQQEADDIALLASRLTDQRDSPLVAVKKLLELGLR